MTKEIIVFDLDGTLRNNDGSAPWVPSDVTKAINWIAWQGWVNYNGKAIRIIADLYCRLQRRAYETRNLEVWIVTSSQFGTAGWLTRKGLPQPNRIIERSKGDNSSPYELKQNFLDNHGQSVIAWIDDCEEVCNLAEQYGIKAHRVDIINGRYKIEKI